jgi:hypothetical protein
VSLPFLRFSRLLTHAYLRTEIAYRSTYSNVEGPPREDSLYDQSSGDESNTGPTRGWKFLCC